MTCSVCGGPLSDARASLGLTVCSGRCARERWQPKDRAFTIEFTSALIRDGNSVLVRVEREWSGDDLWHVEPDRARPASAFVPPRVVEGWDAARVAAADMAKDVARHAEAVQVANEALIQLWPRYADSHPADSPGGTSKTATE